MNAIATHCCLVQGPSAGTRDHYSFEIGCIATTATLWIIVELVFFATALISGVGHIRNDDGSSWGKAFLDLRFMKARLRQNSSVPEQVMGASSFGRWIVAIIGGIPGL